jgi:Pyruvate phosphate dikinase, AMP/ATP-binding domain
MALVILSGKADLDRVALGGKAWSITEMLRHHIPVPPAFTLTTDECARYYEAGQQIPGDVLGQLPGAMSHLEMMTDRTFGSGDRPLLVSVRSGAPVSMPGMMDTVLNLGMTDEVQQALAKAANSAEYAADTRRRFLEQYEKVVGDPAPADPWDQLQRAIAAVFDSWQSDRAIHYRAERRISDEGGTAVTVQAMVFGNLDDASGTGVLFSRDPTGATEDPYGEWLPKGQGEDVVSGAFDPLPLDEMAASLPEAHAELLKAAQRLEDSHGAAMDIEFTVESGKLWLLQSRKAKVHAERGPTHDVQARLPRLRHRDGGQRCRRGRVPGPRRRGHHPRTPHHQPPRRPRDVGRAGYSYRDRRRHLACRGGQPRAWRGLHRRLRFWLARLARGQDRDARRQSRRRTRRHRAGSPRGRLAISHASATAYRRPRRER